MSPSRVLTSVVSSHFGQTRVSTSFVSSNNGCHLYYFSGNSGLLLDRIYLHWKCPSDGDRDGDGTPDASDNCPSDVNTDQADADSDGVGDVCDNCLNSANADQKDTDGNGIGDLCQIHGNFVFIIESSNLLVILTSKSCI